MYDTVPNYVGRRQTQVDIAEQSLPFEPSFGWVGRTDHHVQYRSEAEGVDIQDYQQYRFGREIPTEMYIMMNFSYPQSTQSF